MKVKVLMATLVTTLLLGVQSFANPCDSACVDPCAACNGSAKTGQLFSGLKKLVSGTRFSNCAPCDAVVACNPCDELAACNPCDEVACDQPCGVGLGGRLRNLFASRTCTPCDFASECTPCDVVASCDPCDPCGLDNCGKPKFSFKGLKPFKGLSLGRGCLTDCGPCDEIGDCAPCDNLLDCSPCDDLCGDSYCGPRGRLLELPRISLSKLFGGIRSRCDDGGTCGPCDQVGPCDDACFR